MQLKWCLVAIIFDFLTAIQGVRDQLLHHLCCELPIGDVEAKIFICGTPHILNKTTAIYAIDNDVEYLHLFTLSCLKHYPFHIHGINVCHL
jgi:hypothetical protein